MAEPASAALRRLHEEATREATSTDQLAARARADRTTRDALPALADLVEAAEKRAERCTCAAVGCLWIEDENAALAALAARLRAR